MTTLLTGGGARSRELLDDDVDLARDRVLVTRAQAGDRGAFDDLYVRYYRRLHRFCLRRLHDTYEAEDVAQEAFARAWRALPTFAGDRRFYPWLSVIAAHLCTDVLRRRNRSTPVAEFHQGNIASTEDGGEELMVAKVDSDLVARAFQRLSDRHQRILNLREGSGWSYQRIADHEGVGITAVETLLWRARQALKREFAALAGAEGRTAAWIGGILSLTTLRRLLRLPLHVARRVAHVGQSSPAVAVGSAAAATAMVVAAAFSGTSSPAHNSTLAPNSSGATATAESVHSGSGLLGPHRSAGLVGARGLGNGSSGPGGPAAGVGTAAQSIDGAASAVNSAVGTTAGSLGGTVSQLGGSSLGGAAQSILSPVGGAVSGLLQSPLQSLSGTVRAAGTTLGGGVVSPILGSVASTPASLPGTVQQATQPVSTLLGSTPSTVSSGGTGSSGGSGSTGSTGGTSTAQNASTPSSTLETTATTVGCTIGAVLGTLSGGGSTC